LFRIDRNFVNLGATRSVRVDDEQGREAGAAVGDQPPLAHAAVSADNMAQTRASEIIAEAEEEARTLAEQVLADARDEVAEMINEAREEAEEMRRQAFQDGYAEGAEEGKRSYDDQLATKMREDDAMLKRVISEVYDERERTYSGLEDEVVGLALEIVRKTIAPAEELIGGIFEALIRHALKQIVPDGKVVIHVSPEEYDRFFSSGQVDVELDNGEVISAKVLRDSTLGGGDLVIDTESETINAGINTQLKYIALAFEKMINV